MKSLLSMVGDGNGETSTMRVIVILMALSVLIPHTFLWMKTGVSIPWTQEDIIILGMALTGKLVQNKQESNSTTAKEAAAEQAIKSIPQQ